MGPGKPVVGRIVMILASLIVFAALGQAQDKPVPMHFTPESVGERAWRVLEQPERVTVRIAYPSTRPDPGGERFGLRFVGHEVAVAKSTWAHGWDAAKQVLGIVGWLGTNSLCGFHPDRLVTLSLGEDVVHIETCHRCGEARLHAPDRVAPVTFALYGFDRKVLDFGVPAAWHGEAVLEESIGRDDLSALRSADEVFVARASWPDLGYQDQAWVDAVPAEAWRESSPLLVEALLAAAVAAAHWEQSGFPGVRDTVRPFRSEPALLVQARAVGRGPVTLIVDTAGARIETPYVPDTHQPWLRLHMSQLDRILRAAGLTVP